MTTPIGSIEEKTTKQAFSVSFMIINEESLGLGLLVSQKQEYEDARRNSVMNENNC